MVRKFLFAVTLAASSVVGAVSPAAAQSRGSITLSIGSQPGYHHSDYGYGYRDDRRYYRDRHADWRARERWERRLRWERERAWRESSWRERRWHEGRYRDRDLRYRGY